MNVPSNRQHHLSKRRAFVVLILLHLLLSGGSLFVGIGDLGDANWGSTFLHLRGMRILAACLVGSGLAIAGVVMQGLFRNPLADPGSSEHRRVQCWEGWSWCFSVTCWEAVAHFPVWCCCPSVVAGGLGPLVGLVGGEEILDNLSVLLAGGFEHVVVSLVLL